MKKWRYTYVKDLVRVSRSRGEDYGVETLAKINKLGSEGWELVGVAGSDEDRPYLFVFKRLVSKRPK